MSDSKKFFQHFDADHHSNLFRVFYICSKMSSDSKHFRISSMVLVPFKKL